MQKKLPKLLPLQKIALTQVNYFVDRENISTIFQDDFRIGKTIEDGLWESLLFRKGTILLSPHTPEEFLGKQAVWGGVENKACVLSGCYPPEFEIFAY